jgi:hypothetical protein
MPEPSGRGTGLLGSRKRRKTPELSFRTTAPLLSPQTRREHHLENPFVNLRPEPLSNLDEELNQHLPGELLRLHAQLGFTLLYVTHDRAEASDIGARIVCMRHDHVERTVSIEEF